jgi:hypothetical protein
MRLRLLFALFSLAACAFAVQTPDLDLGAREVTLSERQDAFSDRPVDLRSLADLDPNMGVLSARSVDLEERVREIVLRELLSQSKGELEVRDLAELDPRWVQAVAEGVQAAVDGIIKLVEHIKALVEKDKKVNIRINSVILELTDSLTVVFIHAQLRAQFTQKVIQQASQKYPGMHFVVCGVKHTMRNLRGKFVHHVVKFKKSIGLGAFK